MNKDEAQFATVNGILYLANTHLPIKDRFGASALVYQIENENSTTAVILPKDESSTDTDSNSNSTSSHGPFRKKIDDISSLLVLQPGGHYEIEIPRAMVSLRPKSALYSPVENNGRISPSSSTLQNYIATGTSSASNATIKSLKKRSGLFSIFGSTSFQSVQHQPHASGLPQSNTALFSSASNIAPKSTSRSKNTAQTLLKNSVTSSNGSIIQKMSRRRALSGSSSKVAAEGFSVGAGGAGGGLGNRTSIISNYSIQNNSSDTVLEEESILECSISPASSPSTSVRGGAGKNNQHTATLPTKMSTEFKQMDLLDFLAGNVSAASLNNDDSESNSGGEAEHENILRLSLQANIMEPNEIVPVLGSLRLDLYSDRLVLTAAISDSSINTTTTTENSSQNHLQEGLAVIQETEQQATIQEYQTKEIERKYEILLKGSVAFRDSARSDAFIAHVLNEDGSILFHLENEIYLNRFIAEINSISSEISYRAVSKNLQEEDIPSSPESCERRKFSSEFMDVLGGSVSISSGKQTIEFCNFQEAFNALSISCFENDLLEDEKNILKEARANTFLLSKAYESCLGRGTESISRVLGKKSSNSLTIEEKSPEAKIALSFNQILDLLTMEEIYDSEFNDLFSLTYRHITSGTALLNALIARFNMKILDEAKIELITYYQNWKPVCRLRILAFLKKWIECYFIDFIIDGESRKLLNAFVLNAKYPERNNLASWDVEMNKIYGREFKIFVSIIENTIKQKELEYQDFLSPVPPAEIPKPATKRPEFIDLDYKILAVQMTLYHHDLLKKVKPFDLAMYIWGSKDECLIKETAALTKLSDEWNRLARWVATLICTQPELKNRVKVTTNLIKLGQEFHKLKNYHGVLAVSSGLNQSSVSRLKKTWNEIQPKHIEICKELEELSNPQGNYRAYRTELDKIIREGDACIPMISVFMKDLTFLNDGNPVKLENNTFDFGKLRNIYHSISTILSFKFIDFPFSNQYKEDYYEYCHHLENSTDKRLYQYSQLAEAKAGTEGGTIRLADKWRGK